MKPILLCLLLLATPLPAMAETPEQTAAKIVAGVELLVKDPADQLRNLLVKQQHYHDRGLVSRKPEDFRISLAIAARIEPLIGDNAKAREQMFNFRVRSQQHLCSLVSDGTACKETPAQMGERYLMEIAIKHADPKAREMAVGQRLMENWHKAKATNKIADLELVTELGKYFDKPAHDSKMNVLFQYFSGRAWIRIADQRQKAEDFQNAIKVFEKAKQFDNLPVKPLSAYAEFCSACLEFEYAAAHFKLAAITGDPATMKIGAAGLSLLKTDSRIAKMPPEMLMDVKLLLEQAEYRLAAHEKSLPRMKTALADLEALYKTLPQDFPQYKEIAAIIKRMKEAVQNY
jgi:hypothetical protein